MELVKRSLFDSFLRVIYICKEHIDIDMKQEAFALNYIIDNVKTVNEMIDLICTEYNVSIKLVEKRVDSNEVLYQCVKECATHVFMIGLSDNLFELLEDNTIVTSYFACSSGC